MIRTAHMLSDCQLSLLNLTSYPSLGFYCKVIGVSYQSTYDTIQSFPAVQDTCSRYVLAPKQNDIPPKILSSRLGVVMMTHAVTTHIEYVFSNILGTIPYISQQCETHRYLAGFDISIRYPHLKS